MATQSGSSLANSTVIVIGASSGIGKATAAAFGRKGANVVLAARREEKLAQVADEIESESDAETLVVPTDVSDAAATEELVKRTVQTFGGMDVLVNIAGVATGGPIDETSMDDYRKMMSINADGMFYSTKAALPHLRKSEGNLILIGSFAGHYPYPRNPVYGAIRHWIRGFAQSIEADIGRDGVAVSVVNPSEVRTQVWEDVYDEGEILEPETVADTIVFVARQEPPANVCEVDVYRRDKLTEL